MAVSSKMRGWRYDKHNSRLSVYVDGTEVARFDDATRDLTLLTNGLTVTAGGATITAGGLTVTAGGATITAGNLVVTAGDARITAANLRLGAVAAFGTTEPTSAAVFKQGTEPAGAITTSSGCHANATVLRKIIADGTVSNVG